MSTTRPALADALNSGRVTAGEKGKQRNRMASVSAIHSVVLRSSTEEGLVGHRGGVWGRFERTWKGRLRVEGMKGGSKTGWPMRE